MEGIVRFSELNKVQECNRVVVGLFHLIRSGFWGWVSG